MTEIVETLTAAGALPAARALASRLQSALSGASRLHLQAPLARRTTLRVGGFADLLVEVGTEGDLALVLQTAAKLAIPWMVLGRGSNLLVRDGGIRGVVLCLNQSEFTRITVQAPQLHCGAGVRLKDLAQEARRYGIADLEFLSGIPGTVGGALRMNAGAWNAMTFERVQSIRFMAPDGTIQELPGSVIPVTYRRCALLRDHIALAATFVGTPSTSAEVENRLNQLNEKRWATQPAAPSAGCIFKNPLTNPAGRLVEELGLKGARIGAAAVSTLHGNFIINEGGATAADVLGLIDRIRTEARARRGIELETEVEIVGEP
jgi:UDP-N-acetylenolpyruvoylglucosamine reductase